MKERDDVQRELEQLSPELARLRTVPPRQIPPEGYFDGLADRVLERASRTPLQVVSRRRAGAARKRRWIGLAAALVLAAGLSLYLFRPATPTATPALAGLSQEEARAYVVSHIEDFQLELLLEAEVVGEERLVLPEEEAEEYLYELLEEEGTEVLF